MQTVDLGRFLEENSNRPNLLALVINKAKEISYNGKLSVGPLTIKFVDGKAIHSRIRS